MIRWNLAAAWTAFLMFTLVGTLGSLSLSAQEPSTAPRGVAGTVTLARIEYDQLLDLASRRRGAPEQPPLPVAVTRTDVRVRVSGAIARATVQVQGEVLRSGPVKVPLIKGATLLDARLGERPLPLVVEGDTLFALLAGPSPFSATLETGAPLVIAPGRGSFTLPVPPAGSAMATIDIPGDQMDVRVSPGLVLRRSSINSRTIVEATLEPGTPTQVSWTTRDSAPMTAQRDVRMLSNLSTLVTIGDADVRLMTLVDLTVVQGEPSQITIQLPADYELTSVTGTSLDHTEERPGQLVLFVASPSQRSHQFLVTLERSTTGGSFTLATSFPKLLGVQRETGEVAIEGLGTVEIASGEMPGLRRMDVREVTPALASTARQSLLAAFRYQRTMETPPTLTVEVKRFADAAVLAAAADRAVATTLVTSEGRALTEVTLWVRNRAQPFLKVALPPGASMLSVEVAGGSAKPVDGKDGTRVPLLRPGVRPDGPYVVSFVYLHAGTPFVKKGDMRMMLPRMDLPISVIEWELFVPDRYRADRFAGDVIPAALVERHTSMFGALSIAVGGTDEAYSAAMPGQIIGRVVDSSGAALAGVTVVVENSGGKQSAVTDGRGFYVFSNVPSGPLRITTQLQGFKATQRTVIFDQRPRQVDFTMQVGSLSETVTVTSEAPVINERSSETAQTFRQGGFLTARKEASQDAAANAPSANVQSLQRRAAGVLPVHIEVPRAGTSHRFVKPLVIDEEVAVKFRYRQR
jgi:hypothetical protein